MAASVVFYLPSTGTPTLSPAYSSLWTDTTQATRAPLPRKLLAPEATALTDFTITTPNTAGATTTMLIRQFVSEPLPAYKFQTNIIGTGPVRTVEANTSVNATLYVVIRTVSSTGVQKNPFFNQSLGVEFLTTVATRNINNVLTGSALTFDQGDRLVVEYGVQLASASLTGTVTLRFGNVAGGPDFSNSSGLTTDLNPWFRFEPDPWEKQFNNFRNVSAGDGFGVSI